MRKKIVGAALLCFVLVLSACYYDNPPETLLPDVDQVSFEMNILPIFAASCATANCHDGTIFPDLTPDKAWTEIQTHGLINTTFPEDSKLYRTVEFLESPMPPGGPQISELNRLYMLAWITKGAPND